MLIISFHDISTYFTEHWLEVIAVILSIAGVWLTALEKIINWPINIIASAIYIYIFFNTGIYLDTCISVFYVVFSFYGWYQWLYGGKNKTEIAISKIDNKTIGMILLISVPVTAGLIEIMI